MPLRPSQSHASCCISQMYMSHSCCLFLFLPVWLLFLDPVHIHRALFLSLSSESLSAHIRALRGVGTEDMGHCRGNTSNCCFLATHSSNLRKCPSKWQLNPKGCPLASGSLPLKAFGSGIQGRLKEQPTFSKSSPCVTT